MRHLGKRHSFVFVAHGLLVASTLAMTAYAVRGFAEEKAFPLVELAQELRSSLVVIRSTDRDGRGDSGVGTGFVISSDGLIVTNLHVIGEGRPFEVEASDGTVLPVEAVQAYDAHLDLAVVRVRSERPLKALKLADQPIPVGEQVAAIGNPFGLKNSVVTGVVSGQRVIDGREMLQLAMPIEPGNSGGPVVDRHGRVHGVVTLKSALSENLGFATEASAVRSLLENPNPVAIDRWVRLGGLPSHLWETRFGARWRSRGGLIHVEGAGTGFGGRSLCLSKLPVPEGAFAVEVEVRLADESGAAGVVFHCDGQNRHYGFYPSGGRMRLTCFNGPTVFEWQILREEATSAYRHGDWNHLRVEVQGPTIRCLVNGTEVFTERDATLSGGQVGLAKFRDTVADFRRFRVGPLKDESASPDEEQRWRQFLVQLDEQPEISGQLLAPLLAVPQADAWFRQEEERLAHRLRRLREARQEWQLENALEHLERAMAATPPDLLRGALWIGCLDDPDVDVEAYVEEVEQMAAEIRAALPPGAGDSERLAALDRYLFEQNGFHGSRHEYYHRANSHLHRVISDREGLPITLSVLYIELARRLELPIDGIGLPGHFIVRYVAPNGETQWIDVFNRGRRLTDEAVRTLVRQEVGNDQPVEPFLEPAAARQILERILRNLLNSAERDGEPHAMRRYLEALVRLDPNSVQYRGMRALTRYHTGRVYGAIADLDWFLANKPQGADLERISQMREAFARQAEGR
ncbi:MAG: hypothetical protein KatS3mg110_0815 [Pirellulaceae bacterium]|nr:MAG: hypothetical protein KatS3mg110_0815 [Pirellulaceae bacterium]